MVCLKVWQILLQATLCFTFYITQTKKPNSSLTKIIFSNDVITMFSNITQEIKSVWNSEKQFDRLAGFNFFNELYFEEYNKEDLTQAENELYDKYVREFSEMLIDIQTDIVDEKKEFGVIMKVA